MSRKLIMPPVLRGPLQPVKKPAKADRARGYCAGGASISLVPLVVGYDF